MLSEQIVKDVSELHARLLDHRPVLQGHIYSFVKEFEEKRGWREHERLESAGRRIDALRNTLIPESVEAMSVYLANVTGKLKVAKAVCAKIEEKENNVECDFMAKERERRNKDWEDYMKQQYKNCEKFDDEFEEKIKTLHKHYNELEEKLTRSSNITVP